jgi:predicted nuclease of predicted toxin-antitoxin system
LIRLLADENVPRPSVVLLREAGIDVAVAASGAGDAAVLERAVAEDRILLTLDRDFGRLAFATTRPRPRGIVYLRLRPSYPTSVAEALLAVLDDPAIVLDGRFTTVRSTQLRQRPLR